MSAEVFIDTNVFLYSLSDDPEEQLKAERARQLLLHENWGWSAQVAGEFYYVATSPKRQFRLSPLLARQYVETWLGFPTASVSISIVRDALGLSAKFQISYWDAAIVAAARELGCHTVYSEDLSDGQHYAGVVVVNPFLPRW
jgi:predicted nucleic acid-binding protein